MSTSPLLPVLLSIGVMLFAPSRSVAAQRFAPSGVQRLSAAPAVGTLGDTSGARIGRTRGQRVARGSLIGFGVGALGGAAAFGATYIAWLNNGKAHVHEPVMEIIVGSSMTGAGALIGTVVGAVVGATSGP